MGTYYVNAIVADTEPATVKAGFIVNIKNLVLKQLSQPPDIKISHSSSI